MEGEFTLSGGRRYTYFEWPNVNLSYVEGLKKDISLILNYLEIDPYFLTLDDQATLRIHYVKESKEEIVGKGELFRCGKH